MTEGRDAAPQPPAEDTGKRTAARRLLDVLGAFARGGGSLTLTEISRYAELPLPTAHRLVREIVGWGGLELDDTGHYRLTHKILGLASSSTSAMRLRERALPHLVELHRRTGLTVHLAVRDGRHVMFLEALRSHPNYTGQNRIGGRLPLHVSAPGLLLLAHAGEEAVSEYLRTPLERYTTQTIGDGPTLRRWLRGARSAGYVVGPRFIAADVASAAAPVLAPDGGVETAVGIVYPTSTADPRRVLHLVQATAARITRSLREQRGPDPRTIDFNRRRLGIGDPPRSS